MRKRYKFFEKKKCNIYLTKKIYLKNIYIKYFFKNTYLNYTLRQAALLFLWNNNIFVTSTKLRFICLETGRQRSCIINFKVSRLILKNFLFHSVVNGVYKYSW